jgi:hypothetical protein
MLLTSFKIGLLLAAAAAARDTNLCDGGRIG